MLKQYFGFDAEKFEQSESKTIINIYGFLNFANGLISWQMLKSNNLFVDKKTIIKLVYENIDSIMKHFDKKKLEQVEKEYLYY